MAVQVALEFHARLLRKFREILVWHQAAAAALTMYASRAALVAVAEGVADTHLNPMLSAH
jgi:hypothetical protein